VRGIGAGPITVASWGLMFIGFMKAAFGFRFAPLDFFPALFFFVAIEGVSC